MNARRVAVNSIEIDRRAAIIRPTKRERSSALRVELLGLLMPKWPHRPKRVRKKQNRESPDASPGLSCNSNPLSRPSQPRLGGKARAAALSPERRREIAKKAIAAPWAKVKEAPKS